MPKIVTESPLKFKIKLGLLIGAPVVGFYAWYRLQYNKEIMGNEPPHPIVEAITKYTDIVKGVFTGKKSQD